MSSSWVSVTLCLIVSVCMTHTTTTWASGDKTWQSIPASASSRLLHMDITQRLCLMVLKVTLISRWQTCYWRIIKCGEKHAFLTLMEESAGTMGVNSTVCENMIIKGARAMYVHYRCNYSILVSHSVGRFIMYSQIYIYLQNSLY